MDRKPKLIVFDLDYTLWPFWVDTHVTPPFKKKNEVVVDAHGATVKFYPEVPEMLKYLSDNGYQLGVASRTGEIKGANQLLQLFGWDKYFQYKEIYPGAKTKHFNRFLKDTGFEYSDMLFFDDEQRNIRDISQLKVTCVLVENDLTLWDFQVDKCNFYKDRSVLDCGTESSKTSLAIYKDVNEILEKLSVDYGDTDLAIASRVKDITSAYRLLHFFNIERFFKYKHIYPGKKIAHFFHLHYRSGIKFEDMVFFDDDLRNIRDVQSLGIVTYHVINGISKEQLSEALQHTF